MFGIDAGISGLVSRRQIKREQRFNAAQAAMDREFQSAEAQKQMDFQAEQSSTQYQRAAADLQKAGLNRILAIGSPAASAMGAKGSGSKASYSGPNVAANMISAQQTANQLQEQKARIDLLNQQTRHTSAEADKSEFTRLPYKMANDFLEGHSARSAIERGREIKKSIGEIFTDQKNLMKARSESLKQKAFSNHQKRDRGQAPITTIHLTKPQGK